MIIIPIILYMLAAYAYATCLVTLLRNWKQFKRINKGLPGFTRSEWFVTVCMVAMWILIFVGFVAMVRYFV